MKFWHHTIAKPCLNCQAQSCFNSKLQMPCHWYNVAGSYQYVHHWTPGQKHVPCSLTFRQQATSAGEVFHKLGTGKAFLKQGQVQSWNYCCRFARCLACQSIKQPLHDVVENTMWHHPMHPVMKIPTGWSEEVQSSQATTCQKMSGVANEYPQACCHLFIIDLVSVFFPFCQPLPRIKYFLVSAYLELVEQNIFGADL